MKPVFLRAAIALEAPVNETGALARSFSGVAYAGGVVPYYGDRIVVDLATLRATAPLPLLYLHEQEATIGVVTGVTNSGAELRDAGDLFSDIDPVAQSIAKKSARGLPYQQSIRVDDYSVEYVPPGGDATVNNRNFTGPLVIYRNGHMREITLCALGADSSTSASFFTAPHLSDEQPNPPTRKEATMAENDTTAVRLAEATAENATLKKTVTELTARAEKAEGEANALKLQATSRRTQDVKALFAAMGKPTEGDAFLAQSSVYMGLPEDAFLTLTADLRAARPEQQDQGHNVDPALFQEQAVGGEKDKKDPLTPVKLMAVNDLYARRRKAAMGGSN